MIILVKFLVIIEFSFKKKDVYKRTYIYKTEFYMNIINFIGGSFSFFVLIGFFIISPNDSIRLYGSLNKREKLEDIYKYYKEHIKVNPGIEQNKFEQRINDGHCIKSLLYRSCFLICHCYKKCKMIKHFYIIDKYYEEKLSVENILEKE